MVSNPESSTLVPVEKSPLQIFMMTRQKLRELYYLDRLYPSVLLEEMTTELEKDEEVKNMLKLEEQDNKDDEIQQDIEDKAAEEKKIAMERQKEKPSERIIIHPESQVKKDTKKSSPLVTAPEFVYAERKRVNVCYLIKLLIEIEIENERDYHN